MRTYFPKKLKTSENEMKIFQKKRKFEKCANKFSKKLTILKNSRSNISKNWHFRIRCCSIFQKIQNFENPKQYFLNLNFGKMYGQVFPKFKNFKSCADNFAKQINILKIYWHTKYQKFWKRRWLICQKVKKTKTYRHIFKKNENFGKFTVKYFQWK